MSKLQLLCIALFTVATLGAGAFLDWRVAERDRAARVTDYNDPATLQPGRDRSRNGDARRRDGLDQA